VDDKYNAVETLIKDFIEADTAIMAIANLVHEKIKANVRNYHNHEMPAIAVHATNYIGDASERHYSGLAVFLEVVDAGGNLGTVDVRVKQLMSLLIDKFRKESPFISGQGIDEELEDIVVVDGPVIPWDPEQGVFLVTGNINLEVYFVE